MLFSKSYVDFTSTEQIIKSPDTILQRARRKLSLQEVGESFEIYSNPLQIFLLLNALCRPFDSGKKRS